MNKFVGYFILGSALGAIGATACGSSDSSDGGGQSYQDLCVKVCQKSLECAGTPGTIDCNQNCSSQVASCSNQSGAVSKANECLSKSCGTDYKDCVEQIGPICGGTTGGQSTGTNGGNTGVTTGTTLGTTAGTTAGSTTGTIGGQTTTGAIGGGTGATGTIGGGATGATTGTTPSCDACTKADTCCTAAAQMYGQTTTCNLKASCDGASASTQPTIVQGCMQLLTMLAPLVTACQ